MNEENKIVIVNDDDKVISFQDITIRNDVVDRDEVAQVEREIAELEEQKVAIDDKLVSLKAKILYAKRIIEIADEKKIAEMSEKYMHPMWKTAGVIAKKVGGHGGMDFMMDLRWAYCLQNGLPLDMDVYDLASWCCIADLSERSVRNRSRPVDVPDFTCGGWRTAKPLGIEDFDLSKLDFDKSQIKRDSAQLTV